MKKKKNGNKKTNEANYNYKINEINMNNSFNNFLELMNRNTNNLFYNQEVKNKKFLLKDMVKIVQINVNSLKMIHALTLKILLIKIYDCLDKKSFKDFLYNWQIMKNSNNDNNFIKIQGIDISWKNKSISVIFEYCPLGSLEDLLNNLEFIDQNSTSELIYFLLKNVKIFQNKFKREFGDIRTTQILFNKSGKIVINFDTNNLILNSSALSKSFLNDVFRIGLLGLSCSLGFFINSIIEILIIIYDELFFEISKNNYYSMINLNYYFNIENDKIMFQPNNYLVKEYCCFLHFAWGKKRSFVRESFYDKRLKNFKNYYKKLKALRLNLKEFIKFNFNKSFTKYFCFTTRFDKDERFTIDGCFNHPFIEIYTKSNKNNDQISWYNFVILINDPLRDSNIVDYYSERIFQLVKSIQKESKKWYIINSNWYLTNKMNWDNNENKILDIESEEIKDLSLELGISKQIIWDLILKLNL